MEHRAHTSAHHLVRLDASKWTTLGSLEQVTARGAVWHASTTVPAWGEHTHQGQRKAHTAPVSADEFALWPHAEDVEAGHNMATKYLGARRLYYGANGYGRMTVDGKRDLVPGADASWRPIHTVVLRNDTEGRAALARAKRRLAAMAFVGLVERFNQTLAFLCTFAGIPADAPECHHAKVNNRSPSWAYPAEGEHCTAEIVPAEEQEWYAQARWLASRSQHTRRIHAKTASGVSPTWRHFTLHLHSEKIRTLNLNF